MSVKHFLTLNDLSPDELNHVIQKGIELKKLKKNPPHLLKDKVLAMIFEKASTRTRVSFEAGIRKLGGSALFLSSKDTQLGRGEPIKDSARVISSMVDLVMIRTFEHSIVEEFSEYSAAPVINGLTDQSHPCQLLADMMTYAEHRGSIVGKKVAWIGDGNNMCHSFMQAAKLFGFHLSIASPDGYEPNPAFINDSIALEKSAQIAASNADLVVTDVWASMGQEEEQSKREVAFADYQVNDAIMANAHKNAVFMHCLPAHRGEEVSESVLEGNQSVVWDEAENRMHAQNALMVYLATQ